MCFWVSESFVPINNSVKKKNCAQFELSLVQQLSKQNGCWLRWGIQWKWVPVPQTFIQLIFAVTLRDKNNAWLLFFVSRSCCKLPVPIAGRTIDSSPRPFFGHVRLCLKFIVFKYKSNYIRRPIILTCKSTFVIITTVTQRLLRLGSCKVFTRKLAN